MALLDEDEWFLPHIEEALKSIFKSFDKDEDGALSPAELEAFSVATNGKKVTSCQFPFPSLI